MSTRTVYTAWDYELMCDSPGCNDAIQVSSAEAERDTRRIASGFGWRTDVEHGQDFCPKHR